MVKPMLASEASKVEVGDVGNEVEGPRIGDEIVRVPAMRKRTPR